MRILIDIGHPAHVHFFKNPISILKQNGHEVVVASRTKEMTIPLLDSMHVEHVNLSVQKKGGVISLFNELLQRDLKLYRFARHFRPAVMAGIGGIFISHVGKLLSIPTIAFYDTENASLQNALTYPFIRRLAVPECYTGWTPSRRTNRYRGYHELSYLHPHYFSPEKDVAVRNGLVQGVRNFLIRLVSWQASHDVGQSGISIDSLRAVVNLLSRYGNPIISSECELPDDLMRWVYAGKAHEIHHLMAYCDGYLGESATMASECAVLGVPAIYVAKVGRGYTDEQESRYGLVKNIRSTDQGGILDAVHWLNTVDRKSLSIKRELMLSESVDVADYVSNKILAIAKSV